MAQQLMNVELDEVSLVDVPANQLAKVTLTKRSDPELSGVRFVLGFSEAGAAVASVLFSKEWTPEQATPWLTAHHFTVDKVDTLPDGELRAEQAPSASFSKFRAVTPGIELSKAIQQKLSYTHMQEAIVKALETHVQKEFGKDYYPFLRDLYGDNVVYDDRDSKLWRTPYEVVTQGAGEPLIKFGDRVPVEVLYQDAVAKAKAAPFVPVEEDDEEEPEDETPKKPKPPYDAEEEETYKRLSASLDQSARLSDKLFKLFSHVNTEVTKMNSCHSAGTGQFCASGGAGGGGVSGKPFTGTVQTGPMVGTPTRSTMAGSRASLQSAPDFQVGDKVKIVGNALTPYNKAPGQGQSGKVTAVVAGTGSTQGNTNMKVQWFDVKVPGRAEPHRVSNWEVEPA